MKQENIDFLEANRDCYDEIVRAETATKATKIKHDLIRILREEFVPGYVVSETCFSCMFEVVKLLYRKYDEWKVANMNNLESKVMEEAIRVQASFPVNDKPFARRGRKPNNR